MKKNSLLENFKTLFYAIVAALIIRSFLFEPFSIPSGSMYPTLFVGDYLFVSKYTYGFSRHSLPLSFPIIPKRIFYKEPKRGDVIVFKTPEDNKTDYIKRLIGLPGDEIQFIDGELYINNNQVLKTLIKSNQVIFCGSTQIKTIFFDEKLSNGKVYKAVYNSDYSFQNSDKFIIPKKHFFLLGDNRDCSKDSRFLSEVGYVHQDNLVGKAQFLFFSSDYRIGSILKFWDWGNIVRFNRFFKKIN